MISRITIRMTSATVPIPMYTASSSLRWETRAPAAVAANAGAEPSTRSARRRAGYQGFAPVTQGGRVSSEDDRDPSDLPAGLSAERHRHLLGRAHEPWIRRAVLLVLAAAVALGLANVFGQRASTSAAGPAADLELTAPRVLRGGVLAQLDVRVVARQRIAQPRIVLERGWLDGITVNTVVPEAADQADDDGRLVLAYGALPAGDSLTVRVAIQVNPTTLGKKPAVVELRDGAAQVARVERSVTVLP
jgi:hypothetical protein